ncbi:MAG TPA: ribosome biogenesis GTP-binding protein YihA/YsxC, partial [Xanthobacteraceae bacterium]|nr:ribosome biogenesis GTP-binding protein YihA/YsxC [Xanthobacteraceae bacterium]
FIAAAGSLPALPPMRGVEIAFAGRSNVGKSSLINALTSRKTLARISDTPGRTREVNFFAGPNDLVMVDLPGYGFARAPRDKIEAWTDLVRDYLLGRANLARVYVLIDARHGLKANDAVVLDALDGAAASYAIVLTKADQLEPGEAEARIAATAETIKRRPAAFPAVFATSARTGAGLPELRGAIIRLMGERRAF